MRNRPLRSPDEVKDGSHRDPRPTKRFAKSYKELLVLILGQAPSPGHCLDATTHVLGARGITLCGHPPRSLPATAMSERVGQRWNASSARLMSGHLGTRVVTVWVGSST